MILRVTVYSPWAAEPGGALLVCLERRKDLCSSAQLELSVLLATYCP